MKRGTFQALVGILAPRLTRANTRLRDCIPPEKVLALGIYGLAHGNSYVSIQYNTIEGDVGICGVAVLMFF